MQKNMADQEETEPSPAQDIVVTKYKMAGDMVNGKINSFNLASFLEFIRTFLRSRIFEGESHC